MRSLEINPYLDTHRHPPSLMSAQEFNGSLTPAFCCSSFLWADVYSLYF